MGNFATKKPSPIAPPKRLSVMGYACLIAFASVVLIMLVHQYFHGENGRESLASLNEQIAKQAATNIEQEYRNNLLRADVRDLKTQTSAIEEHARLDLGLIKSGETFFQLSNAPVTYSRQMLDEAQETDAIEPVEGLESDEQTAQ